MLVCLIKYNYLIMKLFWFAIILFSSTLIHSQSFEVESLLSETSTTGKIKGLVFDSESNNDPLLFASVAIKNTTISTTTDLDGSYLLKVKPGNYTLVFSFIGYKTIEVKNVLVTSNEIAINNQTLSPIEINFDISSLK